MTVINSFKFLEFKLFRIQWYFKTFYVEQFEFEKLERIQNGYELVRIFDVIP